METIYTLIISLSYLAAGGLDTNIDYKIQGFATLNECETRLELSRSFAGSVGSTDFYGVCIEDRATPVPTL